MLLGIALVYKKVPEKGINIDFRKREPYIENIMRVYSREILENFLEKHSDAIKSVDIWTKTIELCQWEKPSDIINTFKTAKYIPEYNAVRFKIKGNKYRLITFVVFSRRGIVVKWIGTHKEYDKLNLKNLFKRK